MKPKIKISSVSAIALYIISSIIINIILLILCVLVLKVLPVNSREQILNIADYKYFTTILSMFLILVDVTIFTIILNKLFIVENKKDFLQKFTIILLILTCLGVFINLKNSKSKLYTQFLTLQALEPFYLDLAESDPDSEFYKQHYESAVGFIDDFSTRENVRDGFLNKHIEAVDYYIYQKCEPEIIRTFFEIISMYVFIKFFYKNEIIDKKN